MRSLGKLALTIVVVALAAGPALLTNRAYFDKRICQWDPQTMTAT